MNIEQLAKRFLALASKPMLSKAELAEARELMRDLKEEGMTNEQISQLSDGKWTPSTVKGYVKGVKPGASGEWQSALTLFDQMLAIDMSLDDMKRALTVHQSLEAAHVDLDEVTELVLAADAASVDKGALVEFYGQLKQHSLSVQNVELVLGFKKGLEENGLGLDSLEPMVELAKNYGQPSAILDAVAKYGSITEITEQVTAATEELDNVNNRLTSAKGELQQVQTKASKLHGVLQAWYRVARLGFSETLLTKLAGLVGTHDSIEAVLQMAEGCASYLEVCQKVEEAKANLGTKKAKLEKLDADHAHLKASIDMCNTLINKRKFGLDAIAMVFSVAEQYGEPVGVLKAIERYGKIEPMEHKLGELEGKITAREERLSQLQGRVGEELEKLDSLHAMALKVGGEVAKVQQDVSRSQEYDRLIRFMEEPALASYEESIPLVATITAALSKWVNKNVSKFQLSFTIKDGLNNLLRQLGGD